jgi:hypothetical protein
MQGTLGLWLTAVWAGAMTMIAIPGLLPLSMDDESRRAVGVAAGWAAMMLIAWPQMRERARGRLAGAGFAGYATLVGVLGCVVYGVMMLAP